jgi:pimeloyl-ACP methyl ester carboxylesterase
MPYIDHIYYEETGAGRPVIFIHCPALSHVYWRPAMERLQSICRCIAIDLRGHGRSGLGEQPWTFADICRDLALLTRRRNLHQPMLVGYSAGGSIALQAAVEDPDLYGGVVAVSAFSECCTWTMKAKVGLGLAGVNLGLVRMIGPNIISTNSAGKAHMQAMLPDARGVHPASLRSFLQETLRVNFTDRLGEIRAPVMLMGGTKDDWMHGYYRMLMKKLPSARAIFFPGVDHRVATRRPADFADSVAAFLQEIDRPDDPAFFHPTIEYPGVTEHQLHNSPQ